MLTNLLGHQEQNRQESRVQPSVVSFLKAELGRKRLDVVKAALKYKIPRQNLGLNASCCCSISVSVKFSHYL